MTEIELHRDDFATPDQLHGFLQDRLGFPSYYGRNLAALNDCLEDLRAPTRIVLDRDECAAAAALDRSDRSAESWYPRALRVIQRAGLENDDLDVVVV